MQETTPKLTNRELDLIKHIADGIPNKTIATKLNLSYHTIVHQRAKLYTKLQVTCTADLIRKAVKLKLIEI